ncbi:HAD family hydrolase [Dyella jiangningensis]|uniref:Haloacid dehalogenase n=1 Tax=Dyella jiangningensis TaxID=1379159 RepID=A0A328P4S7_9GAMM|nr:HAD family hydrolase [Dyella jiangningensis]RAO76321.1 haloacid dehalogenase [Dyella jiangningensis]
MIKLVGFDGDDTLWHSEGFYQSAHDAFEQIVGHYVDLAHLGLRDRLLATERRNIRLFGYGAKGMTLSMLEAAIDITQSRISATDLHRIIAIGKEVLAHPVELLPGIRAAVEAVAEHHHVVLITKGDLFHQEQKVASSGLADLFRRIEIVSEKDERAYRRVLAEFELSPQHFAMVGNSLRSDIAPVVQLGGWGVYMPYHVTWAHEADSDFVDHTSHVAQVDGPSGIAAAIEELQTRAAA